MLHRKTGALYVALSGLLFGLIGYFGMSILHENISVNTMLFWRFFISALFMCFIIFIQKRSFTTSPRDIIKGGIYGILFYGPSSTFYFMSANYIGSGLSMVIFYTFPAMVMLFNAIVYKHKISFIYYLAISIMFLGMWFLIRENSLQFNFIGIGWSLLSALLFAAYIILSKNSSAPAQIDTLMVCIGSTLSAYLMAQFDHTFIIPTHANTWINVAGIGIICTAIPILLLLKGLKNIGSLQASILSVLEPVFVLIFGVTLLREVISSTQIIGIFFLLMGAFLALLSGE